ncbi:MAG TPA: alpha-glucosidase/alpha-galactosidase [Spirochaetia bacterium]|nr:alpha-glucosidase/alpha-galactosidase [Spirochaetia bacterium]
MPKLTFMGAGSTVFAKNILGDSMLAEPLQNFEIALYDINKERLEESQMMVKNLNASINAGRCRVSAYLGIANRKDALRGADFVVNAIQVGGYEPSTVIDFEIPKKYGIKQTIADTLGIGGIMRGLRTAPIMIDFAREMEEVCPDALFLNYTNPMAIVTGAVLRATSIRTVGLCHSVQVCVPHLLEELGMNVNPDETRWSIAGINHMAWLLSINHGGIDLYPEIKKRAAEKNAAARKKGAEKHDDMVRLELMRHFGHYVTESSEHNSEYTPYWIKSAEPELIEEFNIPLDEYPRRCVNQIERWAKQRDEIVNDKNLSHTRSHEYGSYIMEAVVTGNPIRIHGNILNRGLISNLPDDTCVEVPCLVDRNGVQGVSVGALPPQCAALNMTNINVQELTIQAVLTGEREYAYQAAYLDPHTAGELSLDRIRALVDDLLAAHGDMVKLK